MRGSGLTRVGKKCAAGQVGCGWSSLWVDRLSGCTALFSRRYIRFVAHTGTICGWIGYLAALEAVLPPLESPTAQIPRPDESTRSEPRKGWLQHVSDDLGWFSQRTRDEQHRLAVEMLNHLPRREELGKQEREICIKCLAGLKHQFGHDEAMVICEKSSWYSEYWQPDVEIQTVYDPSATIGSVIYEARRGGWEFSLEAPVAPKQVEPTAPAKAIPSRGCSPFASQNDCGG